MASEGLSLEELSWAVAHPQQALWELDGADCEESFTEFQKHHWHIVEPTRPYVQSWAMDAIDEHLTAITDRKIRTLLMNVPPGFAKSLKTSVLWPAWEWGPRNKPSTRYVCASYSDQLTIRDNLRARLVMKHPDYQQRWGHRFEFSADQDAKIKFSNDKTGFKIATSVGGLATGERGDVVIVDDPHNVLAAESDAKRESTLQWFTEVMPTRIVPGGTGCFVVIMQRVHEFDVSGLILAKELGYEYLCIPMHYAGDHPHAHKHKSTIGWRGDLRKEGELAFPELFTKEEIEKTSKVMMAWGGRYAVDGQLEQRPTPRGGGMVKNEWFEIVDSVPTEGVWTWCRGWDFASTEGGDGAGSACVKTGEHWTGDTNSQGDAVTDLYVTDCRWDRVSPAGLYAMIRACLDVDDWSVFHSMPKDPGQAGVYQVNDLMTMFSGRDYEFSAETGDKEVRFRPWAAQTETRHLVNRRVKLVRGSWNEVYLDHVTKFPKGRYKDIPDAQSRSYGGIVRRGGGMFLVGGSVLIKGAA